MSLPCALRAGLHLPSYNPPPLASQPTDDDASSNGTRAGAPPEPGDLRLASSADLTVDTTASGTGVLQVYWSGQWGTVQYVDSPIQQLWAWAQSKVACTQLGFAHASSFVDRVPHNPAVLPQWLWGVTCAGTEAHMVNGCSHNAMGQPNGGGGTWDVIIKCVAGEG